MSNYLGMTQPLGGRRILVTGGATGIGAAAVHVLNEAGAAVVATYHRTPPPDREGVSWVQCDVRDAASVDVMVKGAAETLGGLDVLVHAAGLWQPGIPGQITGEDIDFLGRHQPQGNDLHESGRVRSHAQGRWWPDH
jgi:NAD(P)-dependent dehydrogenase (short-subunit alcohol dehydrogenase family)